jgi:hypothetical protein
MNSKSNLLSKGPSGLTLTIINWNNKNIKTNGRKPGQSVLY